MSILAKASLLFCDFRRPALLLGGARDGFGGYRIRWRVISRQHNDVGLPFTQGSTHALRGGGPRATARAPAPAPSSRSDPGPEARAAHAVSYAGTRRGACAVETVTSIFSPGDLVIPLKEQDFLAAVESNSEAVLLMSHASTAAALRTIALRLGEETI